jgi:uncharacterized membrane protein
MIEADIDDTRHTGRIVLYPNMSASWRTNMLFFYAVGGVALVTAVFFAFQGAWLILPFAGLELLALVSVIYYWYRHHQRMEVLSFSDDAIVIQKGCREPEKEWVYEKFWSKAMVRRAHQWYPLQVAIRHRGEEVEIGRFLTDDEKQVLINQLRRVMSVV